MDMSRRRMHSTANRIHAPRDAMNAMPHGVNLTWRTEHSIPVAMNSTPEGMHALCDRLNAIAGHVNLAWRTVNPIRGQFLCRVLPMREYAEVFRATGQRIRTMLDEAFPPDVRW